MSLYDGTGKAEIRFDSPEELSDLLQLLAAHKYRWRGGDELETRRCESIYNLGYRYIHLGIDNAKYCVTRGRQSYPEGGPYTFFEGSANDFIDTYGESCACVDAGEFV